MKFKRHGFGAGRGRMGGGKSPRRREEEEPEDEGGEDEAEEEEEEEEGGEEESEEEEEEAADRPAVRFSRALYEVKGWINLAGWLLIINGVLTALSIVGLLVAWIPIWMGMLLRQAAKSVEQAQRRGRGADLEEGLEKLAKYFKIMGILVVISLVGVFLMLILGVLPLLFGSSPGGARMPVPMPDFTPLGE